MVNEILKKIQADINSLMALDDDWRDPASWERYEPLLASIYARRYGDKAKHALTYALWVLAACQGFDGAEPEKKTTMTPPPPAEKSAPSTASGQAIKPGQFVPPEER